jgi:hypothetical protein
MTTEEFLSAAKAASTVCASHHEWLDRFLGCCDRVKFARHEPAAPDHERLLEETAIFLEETRNGDTPKPGVAPPPEGSGAA